MLSVPEVNRMGREIESWLRMRVHPIAFKLIYSEEEIPEGTVVLSRDIDKKVNLCQVFSMAQLLGMDVPPE